jgi:bacterioferritin-associated ferredoxin
MNLDDHVCLCFRVSRRKLVNWVRLHRPKVPSQMAACGGAGTGCGWCIPFLKQIFRRSGVECVGCHPGDAAEEAGEEGIDGLTADEYAAGRAEYVRSGHGTPPAGASPLPDDPPA